ncbi:MAG: ABC transporter permease [Candidatus Aenigmatarchaeota archaeon]
MVNIRNELMAVYAVWLREFKRFYRDKGSLLGSIARPLMWFLIIGGGIGATTKLAGVSVDYFTFIAPGIIGMTILFTSLFQGVSVIWDREFGFLKEMLVAPVSRTSIVVGKALGGATSSLLQSAIIVGVAYATGVHFSLAALLAMLPLIITISVGFTSMGLTIASLMDTMEGFNVIMNFIVMPMFLLSGALFPISSTGGVMSAIMYADPMTYGVEALRYASIGVSSMSPVLSMSVVLAFAAVMSVIATVAFNRRR